MKPVLAAIQVKKIIAEMTEVTAAVGGKVQATLTQSGSASFGVGPDGMNLVESSMTMDASIAVEGTKEKLLTVHMELVGVFVELEPAIGEKSTPEEAKAAGNLYGAHLYPHAISRMNLVFHEMGFGAVRLNLKYPGSLQGEGDVKGTA